MKKHELAEVVKALAPEDINNLKRMIELGKKPDGQQLSNSERESLMEVVLFWEAKHLPETERTGYMNDACKKEKDRINVLETP